MLRGSLSRRPPASCLFFFNDTATTEIYTLSLHDALPICSTPRSSQRRRVRSPTLTPTAAGVSVGRSEEHTSELQSRPHLVCRLLLEKKQYRGAPGGRCPSPCRVPCRATGPTSPCTQHQPH